MLELKRGTVVEAVAVPAEACDAQPGDRGVVFEEANFHGDGAGPLVRWVRNGHVCNVYDGWVRVLHG